MIKQNLELRLECVKCEKKTPHQYVGFGRTAKLITIYLYECNCGELYSSSKKLNNLVGVNGDGI